jgi:hypothetical protein
MRSKLLLVLSTVICTTIAWAAIIWALLFLWPGSRGPIAIMQFPRPGDKSVSEWQSQRGEFIIRLVSSNVTTSATSVLFSCTSRPPERIWFESLKVEAAKD